MDTTIPEKSFLPYSTSSTLDIGPTHRNCGSRSGVRTVEKRPVPGSCETVLIPFSQVTRVMVIGSRVRFAISLMISVELPDTVP